MLLGTLSASLLGHNLAGKGTIATRQGRGINRAVKGRGIVRTGYGRPSLNSSKINKMDF